MLGKRNPQATLFDGDLVYRSHVGENTFYAYLGAHRHELFRDEEFAELYCANNGRPSVAPSLLCTALVLQAYDRCSDQEAAERAAYDQRWKVALGTTEFERPFVKSTLQLFRAQVLTHEKGRLPFEASIAAAKKVGRLKADGKIRAALDTTAILGRGAVKDTYNLIGDGILGVMRLLARHTGKSVERWAQERDLSPYTGSSLKGEMAIDWDDKEARRKLLEQEVADARKVLKLARQARSRWSANCKQRTRLERVIGVLDQILLDDVEEDDQGRLQIHQGTSGDRICSVHDPEMRHGRKSAKVRFDGHKLAVGVEVESQVIAAVDVMAGSAKDDEGSLELAQQVEANTGLELEAALGDCAYGTGPNRERFADAGMTLLAKEPARPETGFFNKDEFDIDLQAMSCRCPAGEVTTTLVSAGSMVGKNGERLQLKAFQFAPGQCASCPLRDRCFKGNHAGRLVRLNPYEALHQAARQWQHGEGFAVFREQRQVVEHRIARMVQLGVRQARYFGRAKTLFQALMVATVANLTLVAAHGLVASDTPLSITGLLGATGAFATVALALLSSHRPPEGLPNADRLSSVANFKVAGCRPGF
ncbi:MAG TPA: IS1182 family transposase [Candidatus Dormibacteraeota bacterium]